jgi:hypothetical protein
VVLADELACDLLHALETAHQALAPWAEAG